MRQPNGVLTGLFFIFYAVFRIICENFREPDAPLVGAFTRGQFFSFFLIAIGIAFVVLAKLRPTFPKRAPSSRAAQTTRDLPTARGARDHLRDPSLRSGG